MIAHFGSHLGGGANIAGIRIHNALRKSGVESYFYYGAGEPADASFITAYQNRTFLWRNVAALATSWRSRREAPGGFVTSPGWIRPTPFPATPKTPLVAHLHWVPRWLDFPSFCETLPPGLPVVWTLHDFIPVTGGCHYPGTCEGFTRECGNCPQQKKPHPGDATRKFFRTKAKLYQKINLHIVANSEWTLAQAKRSALVPYAKSIRMIHYGMDVDQFRVLPKDIARQALGIPVDKFVVGFSCLDFKEERKGAAQLMEALKTLPTDSVTLVVLGAGKWPASGIDTIALGSMGTPRLQSLFYSALDVFAMPSKVETFGNVAMEAMACETPVVAYAAGGLNDVVADGETGLMDREIGSVPALARMLQWMYQHPAERVTMGKAGRVRVQQHFSDSLLARRHMDLYQSLVPAGTTFPPASNPVA
jgi:glycosyltransferase involved in cell wall biosynthesis